MSCSPLGKADLDLLNFTTHPLVFVLSCLTGNYEGTWRWYDETGARETNIDGDDGFAERFFARGAAVYIGATHVSSGTSNNAAGIAFFNQWDPTEPAGKAFRDYRRDRASTGDSGWEYWAMEYNYYGDPKFGALGESIVAAAAREAISAAAVKTPPGVGEQIDVPNYEVKTLDGKDHVTIPGGDVLIEDGKPMVPYYKLQWELPPGMVVQDVRLRQRTELKTAIGLQLPFAWMMPDANDFDPQARAAANRGWYPTKDIEWRLIPGAGGSSTLLVSLYPFYYNSQTTEVRFYQHYVLDVETIGSGVQITALYTDQRLFQAGEPVTVNVELNATGQATDAIVDVAIRQYGSGDVVAGLLLRRLAALSGSASYSATWNSSGAAPGTYYAQTRIVNPAGQVLDIQACVFKIDSQ